MKERKLLEELLNINLYLLASGQADDFAEKNILEVLEKYHDLIQEKNWLEEEYRKDIRKFLNYKKMV